MAAIDGMLQDTSGKVITAGDGSEAPDAGVVTQPARYRLKFHGQRNRTSSDLDQALDQWLDQDQQPERDKRAATERSVSQRKAQRTVTRIASAPGYTVHSEHADRLSQKLRPDRRIGSQQYIDVLICLNGQPMEEPVAQEFAPAVDDALLAPVEEVQQKQSPRRPIDPARREQDWSDQHIDGAFLEYPADTRRRIERIVVVSHEPYVLAAC
jgi:hypothetical protein